MAKYPLAYVGQVLTADFVDSMIPDVYVKQANETRTSTTTYANDGELAGIPLGVGTWEVEFILAMIGGGGGIAVKTQWSFTGTWNAPLRLVEGVTSGNTAAGTAAVSHQRSAYATNSDCVHGLSSSATYTLVREFSRQITVTVAGNLALSWAPNVNSGSSGGVRQSSTCAVRQIGA